ncbi:conserved hypothetical protein [Neospora caninum Liverpool]|uniref:Uncharacterized protein n=1 Tax=Neospora caninum (strain Liverpool) TaxID=572307 RepID=F0VBM8_NEOCL|nr:conserved hypothetical protein [Neospora caninum Liverpool]CBZ51012.1 conserved hypothetical protein [Neospora caninum Liverpool]CEL68317.1 TPA: hypothetical protein BN1204_040870 [Neospora caninum Liverpool]|eukprot:XP_003881045.1 conserved hypothetical protein [Neospora caninum Liverpool]
MASHHLSLAPSAGLPPTRQAVQVDAYPLRDDRKRSRCEVANPSSPVSAGTHGGAQSATPATDKDCPFASHGARLLRESESLFSSLFRQHMARSPAWLVNELLLLKRLLYKFRRQHRRADFFQKAQSVCRATGPLLSLLGLFSQPAGALPSPKRHAFLAVFFSHVQAMSQRRRRAAEAAQKCRGRGERGGESGIAANVSELGRAPGCALDATAFLSSFVEELLGRALHLQDAAMHASSSAIQQVHLGYHLNLVLPLLAVYGRLLALASALVRAVEQQVTQQPQLLAHLGKREGAPRESTSSRAENTENEDATGGGDGKVGEGSSVALRASASGVRTPDAKWGVEEAERRPGVGCQETHKGGDGRINDPLGDRDEGDTQGPTDAALAPKEAGGVEGDVDGDRDLVKSYAHGREEEDGTTTDHTAAETGDATRALKRQRTGARGGARSGESTGRRASLPLAHRTLHDTVSKEKTREDLLAFLLSEKKKPSTTACLGKKKASSLSSAKKQTDSGNALKSLDGSEIRMSPPVASKTLSVKKKKKSQSVSPHPPKRGSRESGISWEEQDALLSFLLSQKHQEARPKLSRPEGGTQAAASTNKANEMRNAPLAEAAGVKGARSANPARTGGPQGVSVSGQNEAEKRSCSVPKTQALASEYRASTGGDAKTLESSLPPRHPEKTKKLPGSQRRGQTDLLARLAQNEADQRKEAVPRNAGAVCTPKRRGAVPLFSSDADRGLCVPSSLTFPSRSCEKPNKKKLHL